MMDSYDINVAIECIKITDKIILFCGTSDQTFLEFTYSFISSYIENYWYPASFGYLCGSIPFGLLLTKFFLKQDIRTLGSGNIGATNVLRTGNKKLAALTLLLDALKAILPVLFFVHLTSYFSSTHSEKALIPALVCGLFAIIGHCYPVWLKFKGGKGVATTLGVLLAAVPFSGMLACLTWLISAKAGKISSLAAISAMICAPAFTYTFYGLEPAIINVMISLLVIWRHRENIKRIRAGTEPKIGDKKKDQAGS